jgi:hypothetical protein
MAAHTDMCALARDACMELHTVIESHFCGTECIMALQPSNQHTQALAAQLSLRSVSSIASNVQRELQRGNECALEALQEADEPVVFTGARVRLVDVLRCVSATRAHMHDVCRAMELTEEKLSAAVAALCVQPADPPLACAVHVSTQPSGSVDAERSQISVKRKYF